MGKMVHHYTNKSRRAQRDQCHFIRASKGHRKESKSGEGATQNLDHRLIVQKWEHRYRVNCIRNSCGPVHHCTNKSRRAQRDQCQVIGASKVHKKASKSGGGATQNLDHRLIV